MNDLPNEIRAALHADDISAADLEHPTLREHTPRRARRVLAAAAAAAVVLLCAVVLSIVGTEDHQSNRIGAAHSGSLSDAVGYRWRVTRLVDSHGSVSVPSSLHAEIGYTRDLYTLGDDTANALQGNYQPTSDGYTVRDASSTLVGYSGGDPVRLRTISAIDTMFFTATTTPRNPPPPAVVKASVDGDTLTLRCNGVILTLQRVGPQANFFAQSPSATSSPTK